MIPLRRLLPQPRSDLANSERHRTRKVTSVARAPKGERFTQPATGIAIVPAHYAADMDTYVVMLTPRETPADKMLLIDGEKASFVSRGAGRILNKRQERAWLDESNRRALGLPARVEKSALRRRMENDGCILFTDGYVNAHKDSKIAALTAAYQDCFALHPPEPSPNMSAKKRCVMHIQYLLSEAELEHRPLFRRIDTSEIYGEPCPYEENAGNASVVPAVSLEPASPVIGHHIPTRAAWQPMNPTWSAFSLDQGVSSSSESSRANSPAHRSLVDGAHA